MNWNEALRRKTRWSEAVVRVLLTACAAASILITVGIIVALAGDALRFFSHPDFRWDDFLTGMAWDPGAKKFGILALVTGTLMTSLIAMVVAGPVGLAIGVYLADYATPACRGCSSPCWRFWRASRPLSTDSLPSVL
jgi:phosphate transport system permease protein